MSRLIAALVCLSLLCPRACGSDWIEEGNYFPKPPQPVLEQAAASTQVVPPVNDPPAQSMPQTSQFPMEIRARELSGLSSGKYYYFYQGLKRVVLTDDDPQTNLLEEEPLPSEFISILHPEDASPLLPDSSAGQPLQVKKVFEPATWLFNKGFGLVGDVGGAAKTVTRATVAPAIKSTTNSIKSATARVTSQQALGMAAAGAALGLGIWAIADKDMFLRKMIRNSRGSGGYGYRTVNYSQLVIFNTETLEIHDPSCSHLPWVYDEQTTLADALRRGGDPCAYCQNLLGLPSRR